MSNMPSILQEVCEALLANQPDEARRITQTQYPFVPISAQKRVYTALDATRLFVRDGFTDRYSGHRLIFPGTLRLLSILLPDAFPYHPNWKVSETHPMFWELYPTIDHVVPIARGGADEEPNWVTTSQLRNSAKAHWTIEELGWRLYPPGNFTDWDGLMALCLELVGQRSALLEQYPYLMRWYQAAETVCRES